MEAAQAPSLVDAAALRQSFKRQTRALLTPSPSVRNDQERHAKEDAELR